MLPSLTPLVQCDLFSHRSHECTITFRGRKYDYIYLPETLSTDISLSFSHNQVKGCFEILNHMFQRKVISSSYDNFHTRGDDLFMKFVILAEVTVYLPAQDVLLTLPQSLQNSDIFAFRGELHCTLSLITKSLKIT